MLIPMGFLAASGAGAAGAYELISTTLITSNTASVTFNVSAYASTYKHLQIRAIARGTQTYGHGTDIQCNSDTGTNYSAHYLRGNGATVVSESSINSGSMRFWPTVTGTSGTTGSFGQAIYDFVDAFSSSKYKTVKSLYGMQDAGSFDRYIYLASGNWRSTSAITSIKLKPEGGGSFVDGSRFSIYGIKGA